MKVLATHFMKMLNGDGKDEKISIDIMGQWYEFNVMGQKITFLDLLEKVVSMSDRFPLLDMLPSIVAVILTASYERS
jgi:hypothetical protein